MSRLSHIMIYLIIVTIISCSYIFHNKILVCILNNSFRAVLLIQICNMAPVAKKPIPGGTKGTMKKKVNDSLDIKQNT